MSAVFFTCYERLKTDFASTCEQQNRKQQEQQQERQLKIQHRLQQQQRRQALVADSSAASSGALPNHLSTQSGGLLFQLCEPLEVSSRKPRSC